MRGTKKSVSYLDDPLQTPGIDLTGKQISLAPRESAATIIAIGAKAIF
jgi:hypothetical protein